MYLSLLLSLSQDLLLVWRLSRWSTYHIKFLACREALSSNMSIIPQSDKHYLILYPANIQLSTARKMCVLLRTSGNKNIDKAGNLLILLLAAAKDRLLNG